MRIGGLGIGALLICCSLSASAKPKTYTWVYGVIMEVKATGEITQRYKPRYTTSSKCIAAAEALRKDAASFDAEKTLISKYRSVVKAFQKEPEKTGGSIRGLVDCKGARYCTRTTIYTCHETGRRSRILACHSDSDWKDVSDHSLPTRKVKTCRDFFGIRLAAAELILEKQLKKIRYSCLRYAP